MGGYMSVRRRHLLWRGALTLSAGRAQTIGVCFFFSLSITIVREPHVSHALKRAVAREWDKEEAERARPASDT